MPVFQLHKRNLNLEREIISCLLLVLRVCMCESKLPLRIILQANNCLLEEQECILTLQHHVNYSDAYDLSMSETSIGI